jgi:hypothetical protein
MLSLQVIEDLIHGLVNIHSAKKNMCVDKVKF